jgi:hypothetical protein
MSNGDQAANTIEKGWLNQNLGENEHVYPFYAAVQRLREEFAIEFQKTYDKQQLLVRPAGLSGFTYGSMFRCICVCVPGVYAIQAMVPFVALAFMMLSLCASYAALGVRELIRHVFVKTSFMWDVHVSLALSLWLVLQRYSFQHAKRWLRETPSLQWMPCVTRVLTILAFLSQFVGWFMLVGMCPTIFAHCVVQYLHCEGAPVTLHAQANIRLLIFAVTDLGDKLEFLSNHGALKGCAGRPKTRDLLCVLVIARYVLWLTLDNVLSIQHDQNSGAGYELVRVIDYIVLNPGLLEIIQWQVNLQCVFPHMLVNLFVRSKPYLLSCKYDLKITAFYTGVIFVCQTLFPENFSDSVISGCTFLLVRNYVRGISLECGKLKKRSHGPLLNDTDDSTYGHSQERLVIHSESKVAIRNVHQPHQSVRPVTKENKRSARPEVYGIPCPPFLQVGWIKTVLTEGNKLLGPQPWQLWNSIKCVCKPQNPDPMFWLFFVLSWGLLANQFREQGKEKNPVKWFLADKRRATVMILTTLLPVCLALYGTFETHILAGRKQVLETVNKAWNPEMAAPSEEDKANTFPGISSLLLVSDWSNWTWFARDTNAQFWEFADMNGKHRLGCITN